MSLLSNFYNGIDSSSANDFIPLVPSRQIRRVINPTGLPLDNYLVWFDCGNPKDLLSISQFALGYTSLLYFVRIPTAFPNIWGPWISITGIGGGGILNVLAGAGITVINGGGPNVTVSETNPIPSGLVINNALIWNGVAWVSQQISSNIIANNSIVAGVSVTGALDQLQNEVNAVIGGLITTIQAGAGITVTNPNGPVVTVAETNAIPAGLAMNETLIWNGISWASQLMSSNFVSNNSLTVAGASVSSALDTLQAEIGAVGGVITFNGRNGNVVSLAISPYDYGSDILQNNSVINAGAGTITQALNFLDAHSGVSSFNGRVGAVVPLNAPPFDYTSSQLDNTSLVVGLTVTDALNTLQSEAILIPGIALTNDTLVFNGAQWVANSQNGPANLFKGNVQNLVVATLTEYFPNTAITGNVAIALTGDTVNLPMYSFSSTVYPTVNTPQFQIICPDPVFNTFPGAVFQITAPNSTTNVGGTNFINCFNNSSLLGNKNVFSVGSDGTVYGKVFAPSISLRKYKRNIEPLILSSTVLKNIIPSTYNFLQDPEDLPPQAGLMHEDIKAICPEACLAEGYSLTGVMSMAFSLMKDMELRISQLEQEILLLKTN
jgi:hypothetical protein